MVVVDGAAAGAAAIALPQLLSSGELVSTPSESGVDVPEFIMGMTDFSGTAEDGRWISGCRDVGEAVGGGVGDKNT